MNSITKCLIVFYYLTLGMNSLTLSNSRSVSFILSIAIILAAFFNLLNSKTLVNHDKTQRRGKENYEFYLKIFIFLLVLWNLLSVFWSNNTNATVQGIFKIVILASVTYSVIHFCGNNGFDISPYFVSGAVLTSGITILAAVQNKVVFYQSKTRMYGRWNSFGLDFNDMAVYLDIAFTLALIMIINGKRPQYRLLLIASLPILVLGVIASGSRTGLVGLLISPIVVVYFSKGKQRLMRIIPIVFIFIALIIFLKFSADSLSYSNRALTLFKSDQVSLTGRDTIWRIVISSWSSWIVLGVGQGNELGVLYQYFGVDKAVHNLFLSISYRSGLIGLLLFIFLLLNLYKSAKYSITRLEFLGSFTIALFLCQTLSWEYNRVLWALFPLAISHKIAKY